MASPRSISASVAVSGGAMRNVPPIPGSCTMFMCRPSSTQRRVTAAPSRSAPPLGRSSDTSSTPDQQAPPPDVADHLVPQRELVQAAAQPVAELAGAQVEPVALQHVQHGVADGGGQRVVDVRGEEQESALVGPLLDLGAGQHGGQRQAGAEGLGQGEDVGDDAVALERVPVAGAAQPGLRLVEDQQHAALGALVPQRGQVARREVDDAAGAEDRLDEAGGEAADRLGVDQVETEVELAAPVEVAVGVSDGGPEPVGRGEGEVARSGGAVARPGPRCRWRSRPPGSSRARTGRTRRPRACR